MADPVPIDVQLYAARKELRRNRVHYRTLVSDGLMAKKAADAHLAVMAAIVQTLLGVMESRQLELFCPHAACPHSGGRPCDAGKEWNEPHKEATDACGPADPPAQPHAGLPH
jgi:hypothetical protein